MSREKYLEGIERDTYRQDDTQQQAIRGNAEELSELADKEIMIYERFLSFGKREIIVMLFKICLRNALRLKIGQAWPIDNTAFNARGGSGNHFALQNYK